MKKIGWIVLFIPVVIVLVIISQFIITPIENNLSLIKFSSQLDDLKQVQGVTFLEKQSICGKLNGNGMDFLACMLVKSNLTAEVLKNLYNNPHYKTSKKGSNSIVEFEVVTVTQNKLDSEFLEHQEITFNKLKGITDFSDYYALVIYDGGYSADFDIRGH